MGAVRGSEEARKAKLARRSPPFLSRERAAVLIRSAAALATMSVERDVGLYCDKRERRWFVLKAVPWRVVK